MDAIRQKYRAKLKKKSGQPNLEAQGRLNEELQALMRKAGVSPLGGYLPMALQMPFFLALYTLLDQSVELWNSPWALWIHDLSASDPLYILPILMAASQYLQQFLVGASNGAPGQRVMLNMMPA